MKSKLLIATLCVGLVSQWWAMSQTDTNSVATNQPAMSESAPAAQPATATTTETTAPVAANAAAMPAASTGTSSPSAAGSNDTASVTASSTPAMTKNAGPSGVESTNETAGTTSNAPVVLPIQFQDVPITTAIENLARQAGINYLLDPKIGYGQPDQNGQIKAEPALSIRWENVTAEQALLALLNNYDLQLVMDPRTKIGRISIKDPTAPPPLITRVVQLKYASTSNMVQSVQAAFTDRRSHVFPDVRTSQLVVVATENEQDEVDQL